MIFRFSLAILFSLNVFASDLFFIPIHDVSCKTNNPEIMTLEINSVALDEQIIKLLHKKLSLNKNSKVLSAPSYQISKIYKKGNLLSCIDQLSTLQRQGLQYEIQILKVTEQISLSCDGVCTQSQNYQINSTISLDAQTPFNLIVRSKTDSSTTLKLQNILMYFDEGYNVNIATIDQTNHLCLGMPRYNCDTNTDGPRWD